MSRYDDGKSSVEIHTISLEDQIGECVYDLKSEVCACLICAYVSGTAIRTALTEVEQDTDAAFTDSMLLEVS